MNKNVTSVGRAMHSAEAVEVRRGREGGEECDADNSKSKMVITVRDQDGHEKKKKTRYENTDE
jgi:hypothetical protein